MTPEKKTLRTLVKLAISFGILGFLFYQLGRDQNAINEIWNTPKQWSGFVLAGLTILIAAIITFKRWHLLVCALGLQFSLRDAIRLGFVGYLFNFLSLGIAGGDVVKTIFLVREQAGKRTEAVATVVLDRFIGLYAMMLVATVSVWIVDLQPLTVRDPQLLEKFEWVGTVAIWLTLAGSLVITLVLLTGMATSSVWDSCSRLPVVGPTILRLVLSVRTYRHQKRVLLTALLMSITVHVLLCIGIYLIARGLTGTCPSLATHFVMIPIANVANIVPLPGGLGALELALDTVYRALSPQEAITGQGFIVALGYRFLTLCIAGFGMFFWVSDRDQMGNVLQYEPVDQSPPGKKD